MIVEPWNQDLDGPLSTDSMVRKLESRGYRCSVHSYPPGTCFPEHAHDVDKIDAVVAGRFRISMGGFTRVLGPGDCIAVPKGQVHRAEVAGGETVLSVDGVATLRTSR